MPALRARRHYHNVLITLDTIAAATTVGETILTTPATIDEDPDHTKVSNGTDIAECESGARVMRTDLTLEIAKADAAVDDTFPVTFMVWKDSTFGALASPGNATEIFVPSTTLQLAELKKNTCMSERFLITAQGDKRRFHLKIPRRLRALKQGERYAITITNHSADAAVVYTLFGKIITIS